MFRVDAITRKRQSYAKQGVETCRMHMGVVARLRMQIKYPVMSWRINKQRVAWLTLLNLMASSLWFATSSNTCDMEVISRLPHSGFRLCLLMCSGCKPHVLVLKCRSNCTQAYMHKTLNRCSLCVGIICVSVWSCLLPSLPALLWSLPNPHLFSRKQVLQIAVHDSAAATCCWRCWHNQPSGMILVLANISDTAEFDTGTAYASAIPCKSQTCTIHAIQSVFSFSVLAFVYCFLTMFWEPFLLAVHQVSKHTKDSALQPRLATWT